MAGGGGGAEPVTAGRFVCPGSGARPAGSDPDFAPVRMCGLRHLGFSASQQGWPQYLPHSVVLRASIYTGKALVADEPFMSCYECGPGMVLSFSNNTPGHLSPPVCAKWNRDRSGLTSSLPCELGWRFFLSVRRFAHL